MYQAHHCERQRGNPVTSYPSLRASAWQSSDIIPVIASEAWQSSDLTPVIASEAWQSIKIPFQAKTPEWRCSQIVIFLKVEGTLVPKRLRGQFVI